MYIIVIGCGRLGSNLAKELADDGHDICIIDRDNDKLRSLGSGFNGQRIKGIEFDSDRLFEAGIEVADAILAVTADDNVNITVSLIAEKIYHVPKIIARVNDPERQYIYDKLEIKTINPVQLGVKILKSRLFVKSLDIVSTLDNDYEIIELLVSKDKSTLVQDIEDKYSCIISGVIRDGNMSIPAKNTFICNGDRIICTIQKKDKGKFLGTFTKEMLL